MAAADGITDILATPHITPGVYDNDATNITSLVAQLTNRLVAESIPVRLHVGADVRVDADLVERVERGEVPVAGGETRYLVAELPAQMIPPNVLRLLYELQLRRIVPIITHPERNAAFQRDPNLLAEMVSAGSLAQVTASSLTGEFGPVARRAAVKMLERRLIHIIASDAHGVEARRPILSAGVAQAAAIVGESAARDMVTTTPQAILSGLPVSIPEPLEPSSPLGFLSRLF
jgi:protein-tyrosine phosphatase